MTLPVLTAVTGAWEAPLVGGLEQAPGGVRVVRRCADLADLLAAAAAGLARAAVVSADLHRLDGDALHRLAAAGVAVVGLAAPGSEQQERRLRQLGVASVVSADAPAADVAAALAAAVAALEPAADPDVGPSARPADASDAGGRGATSDETWLQLLRGGGLADTPRPAPAPGRLVAVWGPAGAPGRTTVAITIAAELAALGEPTLLVDADTTSACVAPSLALLDEAPGLAAAVRAAGQGRLDVPALDRLAPHVAPRLRVLTGLSRPQRWPELRPAGLEQVWERSRALARWTVVDCAAGLEQDEELSYDTAAPRRNGATRATLAAADIVLAVGAADPLGLQRLVRGLQELAEACPGRAPRVVVTRVRASAVGADPQARVRDALARFAGVSQPTLVPDDRPALDAALLAGRTLTEAAPSSPARRALAGLAAELAGAAPPASPARARWRPVARGAAARR